MLTFDGELSISCTLQGELGVVTKVAENPYPAFPGPYEVTPNLSDQVLETAQKRMTEDLTVKAVPVYRTANPSGGNTIIIGG